MYRLAKGLNDVWEADVYEECAYVCIEKRPVWEGRMEVMKAMCGHWFFVAQQLHIHSLTHSLTHSLAHTLTIITSLHTTQVRL
jgi:hypothetical protein